MAGVSLNEAGNAILYQSVPWARNLVSLKTASFPKGSVPSHLRSFLFTRGGLPSQAAQNCRNASGAAKVRCMNSFISARAGQGRGG